MTTQRHKQAQSTFTTKTIFFKHKTLQVKGIFEALATLLRTYMTTQGHKQAQSTFTTKEIVVNTKHTLSVNVKFSNL